MEANHHRKKFVCKFCNKTFPCGKSLGGHIRIHLNSHSTDHVVEEEAKLNIQSKRDLGLEAAPGQSGYGLRENPRKTRRFVLDISNNTTLLQDKICKECGKGFQSLKALCGHMACHSKNSSSCFEDHSVTNEKLKDLVFDSQSETEASTTPSKRTRSTTSLRYKTVIGARSFSPLSSAFDIEQEQEEVARSLMMLSRDSGFKGCFSSVAVSSDNNNFAILEAKPSATKVRIRLKNGANCVFDNGNSSFLEMKKPGKREVTKNYFSENSDSGYFRIGPKKIESDQSVDGISRNGEFKKQKIKLGSRFDDENFDAELRQQLSKFRRIKTGSGKHDSRKRDSCESYNNPEFRRTPAKGKCFSLVGDGTINKRPNGYSESMCESGENSFDADHNPSPPLTAKTAIQSCNGGGPIEQNFSSSFDANLGSKKGKIFECPFCSKVFRSGRALGGHKRSHFVGSGARTVVIKQEVAKISMPGLIDLNLPAPVEEEANVLLPW